jgi:murein tripeptide amidase MpaA
VRISSNFDSGNIQVIRAEDPLNIQLSIRKDNQSEFYQWFHFKLETQSFISHQITSLPWRMAELPGSCVL